MFEDRWYQRDAINAIFGYFGEHAGNPLVAMPTGTGKSIVIARFIRDVMRVWPNQRFLVLTHVKELVKQNAEKMAMLWPDAPMGIYSAGLKSRDTIQPIIFGGVASVVRRVPMFGHRDLLFIDEAHLLSPDDDTMYQRIISELKAINPYLKVVGFTATWFRLGHGLLTNGGLFTDIAYNICDVDGFNRLIFEGFMSPLIPKRTKIKLDVSGVATAKGDYVQSQIQQAVDKPDVTYAALTEICEQGQDRKSWLIFCSGIEHAEHCAEMLESFGVSAAAVHSNLTNEERDRRIAAFKAGDIRAITNNNILTTGFDHEPIDLIGMLRPTLSPVLWVQMLGRGTRPFDLKENCLVLDFARNTERLGPINDPLIPQPKGQGTGEVPIKICDHCGTYNHARVKFCVNCGAEFIFQTKIVRTASTHELITGDMPIVEWFNIDRLMYTRHLAKGSGKVNIKCSYFCGLRMFNEFVSFDQTGYPLHKAHEWWRQRHADTPPFSTDMALMRLRELRTPRRIKVWVNKKFPEVIGYEW